MATRPGVGRHPGRTSAVVLPLQAHPARRIEGQHRDCVATSIRRCPDGSSPPSGTVCSGSSDRLTPFRLAARALVRLRRGHP